MNSAETAVQLHAWQKVALRDRLVNHFKELCLSHLSHCCDVAVRDLEIRTNLYNLFLNQTVKIRYYVVQVKIKETCYA